MNNIKKLIVVISASVLWSCHNNTPKKTPSKVDHTTLLVATEGNIFNFDLDKNTIAWQYKSPIDSAGNRNLFVLDGQNIFMPFESGKFINFDLNTGKIIWQQQIYGNEGTPMSMSNDPNAEAAVLRPLVPLFMAKPLVDDQNILMVSAGQPENVKSAWLYNFNRTNGERKWLSELPTVYNYFAPVKYRDSYFVNSAVFLNKYSIQNGTDTSYGMFDGDVEIAGQPRQHHEPNQFANTTYSQVQTDGEHLFITEDSGNIYALNLNKDGNLPDGDISDPNNTFIKNPKVFKWAFQDKTYGSHKSNRFFLKDGTLYIEFGLPIDGRSCLFTLNADDGKMKWRKMIPSEIKSWTLSDEKIIGYTAKGIFYMDTNGENYTEFNVKNLPISDITSIDKTHFVYITQKGIEIFDTAHKTANLVVAKAFNNNEYNNLQIQYISK